MPRVIRGMAEWRRALRIGAVLALAAGPACGRVCLGVAFPERIDDHGTSLALNGLGLRSATIFGISVYVAALYVSHPSTDAATLLSEPGPKRLILHFVRGVGAGRIRDAWNQGFADSAGAQLPALQSRVGTLNDWMADVKIGQSMVFDFIPADGVSEAVDGVSKGTIPGEDFSRALLEIWLGAHPPNPALKTGLLGGACG